MEHPPRKHNQRHLARMRKICMAYPEVVEVEQFGNPWWKAGKKSFCIYGESDGQQGASFNLSLLDQSLLPGDPRFYKTGRHHGWTSMRFSGEINLGAGRRAGRDRLLPRRAEAHAQGAGTIGMIFGTMPLKDSSF